MPIHDGSRSDQDERLSTPTRLSSMRPRTACAGRSIDGEAFSRAELAIADGEPGFRGRGLPGTTSADHPAQEMPEKHNHDKHFVGTVRIEPVAMSFILRVYEVLASHTAPNHAEAGKIEGKRAGLAPPRAKSAETAPHRYCEPVLLRESSAQNKDVEQCNDCNTGERKNRILPVQLSVEPKTLKSIAETGGCKRDAATSSGIPNSSKIMGTAPSRNAKTMYPTEPAAWCRTKLTGFAARAVPSFWRMRRLFEIADAILWSAR
jgi:hypothetical protein